MHSSSRRAGRTGDVQHRAPAGPLRHSCRVHAARSMAAAATRMCVCVKASAADCAAAQAQLPDERHAQMLAQHLCCLCQPDGGVWVHGCQLLQHRLDLHARQRHAGRRGASRQAWRRADDGAGAQQQPWLRHIPWEPHRGSMSWKPVLTGAATAAAADYGSSAAKDQIRPQNAASACSPPRAGAQIMLAWKQLIN